MHNCLSKVISFFLFFLSVRLFVCLEVKSVIPLCIFQLQLVVECVGELFLGPAQRTVSLSRENMLQFLDFLLKSWHRLLL